MLYYSLSYTLFIGLEFSLFETILLYLDKANADNRMLKNIFRGEMNRKDAN